MLQEIAALLATDNPSWNNSFTGSKMIIAGPWAGAALQAHTGPGCL